MELMGVLGELQTRPLIPHGVVLGHVPLVLYTENLGERCAASTDEAVPTSGAGTAKRWLQARRNRSARYRLAAVISVIPASASSLGSRSCRIRKTRSDRPCASGE